MGRERLTPSPSRQRLAKWWCRGIATQPFLGAFVQLSMQSRRYYQDQADHARRLAGTVHQEELVDLLTRVAEDYDDIADDLDKGAIKIRHPELLKQPGRHR